MTERDEGLIPQPLTEKTMTLITSRLEKLLKEGEISEENTKEGYRYLLETDFYQRQDMQASVHRLAIYFQSQPKTYYSLTTIQKAPDGGRTISFYNFDRGGDLKIAMIERVINPDEAQWAEEEPTSSEEERDEPGIIDASIDKLVNSAVYLSDQESRELYRKIRKLRKKHRIPHSKYSRGF